jgi:hypothetical protein
MFAPLTRLGQLHVDPSQRKLNYLIGKSSCLSRRDAKTATSFSAMFNLTILTSPVATFGIRRSTFRSGSSAADHFVLINFDHNGASPLRLYKATTSVVVPKSKLWAIQNPARAWQAYIETLFLFPVPGRWRPTKVTNSTTCIRVREGNTSHWSGLRVMISSNVVMAGNSSLLRPLLFISQRLPSPRVSKLE